MARLGIPWALTAGFDLAFLHQLVAALEGAPLEQRPCTALPFRKVGLRRISEDCEEWLRSVYLLLIEQKVEDDHLDGGGLKARLAERVVRSRVAEAKSHLRRSDAVPSGLAELSVEQKRLEQSPGLPVERYGLPTTKLFGEIFSQLAGLTGRPADVVALRRLGQGLGMAVYLKDGLEDRQRDRRSGSFNAVEEDPRGLDDRTAARILRREVSRAQAGLRELSLGEDGAVLESILGGLVPQEKSETPRRFKKSNRGICEALLCEPLMYCSAEICVNSCAVCPCDCCVFAANEKNSSATSPPIERGRRLSCPACDTTLLEQAYHNVVLDECPACHGVWMDKGELETVCSTHPPKRLLEKRPPTKLPLRPEGTRPCPICSEIMTGTLVKGVHLDLCPVCEGLWLDQGELNGLL